MRFKTISILLISILFLVVGCTNSKDIVEIASTDDVKQLLDIEQKGFTIVPNEKNYISRKSSKSVTKKRNQPFNSSLSK